jgi:hypothetical protein
LGLGNFLGYRNPLGSGDVWGPWTLGAWEYFMGPGTLGGPGTYGSLRTLGGQKTLEGLGTL